MNAYVCTSCRLEQYRAVKRKFFSKSCIEVKKNQVKKEAMKTIGISALYVDPNERNRLKKSLKKIKLKHKENTEFIEMLNINVINMKW